MTPSISSSPVSRSELAERRLRRTAVALAMLPSLAVLAFERAAFGDAKGFPLDDPWIHLVFARQLAAGEGLAFRAGELVAGSTAPLWTAMLSVLALLPGATELWAKAAGLACHALALALVFRVARRFDLSPHRSALATLLVGLSDGLALAAPSGMEVPLFTALFAAGLLRHLEERRDSRLPPVSFLLWALAALTRPEALLLLPIALVDRALAGAPSSRPLDAAGVSASITGLGVAMLLLVPVGAAFAVMSGSPLPTTFGAKSSGLTTLLPPLRHLQGAFGVLFATQPLPALLAAGGFVELLRRRGSRRDAGLLLPLWTLAVPVVTALLSGDGPLLAGSFGRYLYPAVPGVVLLALLALEPLAATRARSPGRRGSLLATTAVVLLLVAPALGRAARAPGLFVTARANVEQSDGRAAAWLAANAPADALIATIDIGVLGWRLPNPLLDLGGIVDSERRERFARAAAAGQPWPVAVLDWVEERRPEYVVLFPRWLPLLDRQPQRFPALVRFEIDRNIAMSGDQLVVYATPWTRSSTLPSDSAR